MKTKVIGAIFACALAASASFVGWLASNGEESTGASPALTLGVDADPYTSPANTATSLGSIESLKTVACGETFDIDLYITEVADLLVWHVILGYDPTILAVTGHNVQMLQATNPGSEVVDHSYGDPGLGGGYELSAKDLAAPDSGSGVLARLTLQAVGIGASELSPGDPFLLNSSFGSIGVGSMPGATVIVSEGTCPPLPTPQPTPTSTPPPTATPTSPTPVPTPTAAPPNVDLVAGWNDACYIGVAQPIDTALGTAVDDVLAVYRLGPQQGFDRWFPNRPEISTIATLDPYDHLFILVSRYALWQQPPPDTPPTSVSLATGWNTVCYTGTAKDAEAATASIAADFAVLYSLALDQSWRRFVPGRPEVSNLTHIDASAPVLILVTKEGGTEWVFDP